jgi:hypothetical protein
MLEYAVFISAVIAALVAMTFILRQKTESSLKTNADAWSEGRQMGSHSGGSGGPAFQFPSLPGLPNSSGTNPTGGNPECNPERIKALAEEANAKQATATQLAQEAATAQQALEQAKVTLIQLQGEAKDARDAANQAWQAANDKQQECDECNDSGAPPEECDPICEEATSLADEASAKENVARQKEAARDAAQAEVDRLQPIADQKQAAADQAQQEAVDAASALESAQRSCLEG